MDSFDTDHDYKVDLKDRYNYASSHCAASVLKVNKEVKGGSRILNDNRDSYMLTPCHVKDKFIIVELCEDILIDTIVLGNFEYFSSTFRTFKLHISQRYPPTQGWVFLNEFTALNTKRKQIFRISNPILWARFIKIEFTSHFDNEYYCPLSLVQIYGTSMIEEYKRFVDDADQYTPLALPSGSDPITNKPQEDDYLRLDDPEISNLKIQHAVYVEEWLTYCKVKDFEFYFSDKCFYASDAHKEDILWESLSTKLPQSVFTSIISGLNHLERNIINLIQQVHQNNAKISDKFRVIDKKIHFIQKSVDGLNATLYEEIAKLKIVYDIFEKKQKTSQVKLKRQLHQEMNDLNFKLETLFMETLENRKWDRFRTILIVVILMIVLVKSLNLSKYATFNFSLFHSNPSTPVMQKSRSLPQTPELKTRSRF